MPFLIKSVMKLWTLLYSATKSGNSVSSLKLDQSSQLFKSVKPGKGLIPVIVGRAIKIEK